MPHCVIEHSSDIDGDSLIPLVFSAAMDAKLFEKDGSDIKVRALSFSHYLTGHEKTAFIHVALKLLSGRDPEQKAMLSALVLEQLKIIDLPDCSITVEVIDIDRSSYSKLII